MNPNELATFKARLVSAFTEYDRRDSTKRHYNRNALGIYFQRADDICADVAAGADPRAAICAGLSDRLLAFVLRKMDLTAPSNAECRGLGSASWPASEGDKMNAVSKFFADAEAAWPEDSVPVVAPAESQIF